MPKKKLVADVDAREGDGKRYSLNMRTTRKVREALEQAAALSGRSLVQEVEFRLEQSFMAGDILERLFGGQITLRLFLQTASVLHSKATIRYKCNGDEWITSCDEAFPREIADDFAELAIHQGYIRKPLTDKDLRASVVELPDPVLPEDVRFETPEERAAGWDDMLKSKGLSDP